MQFYHELFIFRIYLFVSWNIKNNNNGAVQLLHKTSVFLIVIIRLKKPIPSWIVESAFRKIQCRLLLIWAHIVFCAWLFFWKNSKRIDIESIYIKIIARSVAFVVVKDSQTSVFIGHWRLYYYYVIFCTRCQVVPLKYTIPLN